jgi:hypothetical protein
VARKSRAESAEAAQRHAIKSGRAGAVLASEKEGLDERQARLAKKKLGIE